MRNGERYLNDPVEVAGLHMESRRARVLCYGHDDMLLYTRKRILDREFSAEICDQLAKLPEFLARGPVDLVVLCQSVPDWECDAVIELSRAAWPGVKILTLHDSTLGECSAHADRTMENLEGPPALLHEIRALVTKASAENAAHP
jgi:hypothetical protein